MVLPPPERDSKSANTITLTRKPTELSPCCQTFRPTSLGRNNMRSPTPRGWTRIVCHTELGGHLKSYRVAAWSTEAKDDGIISVHCCDDLELYADRPLLIGLC
jgi:hypothetical protein